MRKRILFAFMFVMAAAGSAVAQGKITFGPKIGVDYTHFWGKDATHGGQFNYQAGMFMEYRFNDKFALAPEVVFAAQGGKYDFGYYDPDPNSPYADRLGIYDRPATFHMNYINVPFMFKYYVTPSLSIDFGPQLGINVYSKVTIGQDPLGKDKKEVVNLRENTKPLDLGLGLGATYNITEKAFVQARYTMGMTYSYEVKAPNGVKDKNGNAQISIGFRF